MTVTHAAAKTMAKLHAGHARFRREVFPAMREHFRLLATAQHPDVLFITCSDSRVVPDMILQTGPGDLFVCRNAGNVVPPYKAFLEGQANDGVSATIEYAVKVLGVGHVVICGHSDCGAVRAVVEERQMHELPIVSRWLRYVQEARSLMRSVREDADGHTRLKEFICANVCQQVKNLRTHPEVQHGLSAGTLEVHGWFYDIRTGEIEVVDVATGGRRPLVEETLERPAQQPTL